MRLAPRKDRNHGEIANFLRAAGWGVFDISAHGKGLGDLLVSRQGFSAIVEIKDGDKPPSARKLTPAELKFSRSYLGPYIVATSLEDAEHQLRYAYDDAKAGRGYTVPMNLGKL